MTKELVDEKATKQNGSQENSLPPLRGRVGVGGSLTMGKYEPRPCGCSTRKLVHNHFPARKGWGLRDGIPQSLISSNHFTHSTHLTHFTHFKKTAFTLAEVLVTLAVIGIVAAMTIPTVMNKYNQILAETRLKLFYSTMNNAIALSEIDNGDKTTWHFDQYSPCISNAYSKDCIVPLFEKYFEPYLKIAGYEFIENFKYLKRNVLKVDFQNGSTVLFTYRAQDFYFYPVGSHYNSEKHQTDNKDRFIFAFYPNVTTTLKRNKYFVGKGIEAYIENSWDGTEENLPCIKKVQLNGWKFPDDCNPFK